MGDMADYYREQEEYSYPTMSPFIRRIGRLQQPSI